MWPYIDTLCVISHMRWVILKLCSKFKQWFINFRNSSNFKKIYKNSNSIFFEISYFSFLPIFESWKWFLLLSERASWAMTPLTWLLVSNLACCFLIWMRQESSPRHPHHCSHFSDCPRRCTWRAPSYY